MVLRLRVVVRALDERAAGHTTSDGETRPSSFVLTRIPPQSALTLTLTLDCWRASSYHTSGYFHIQATRPHTVGVGLNDSPAGLAAWILEKFGEWAYCGEDHLAGGTGETGETGEIGAKKTAMETAEMKDSARARGVNGRKWGCRDPSRAVSMDGLLTNLLIYWTTHTATSSARLYKEAVNSPAAVAVLNGPIDVPTGLLELPGEIFPPPRGWLGWRYNDIVRYTRGTRGGHFAAMEQPALLAGDVAAFVEAVEARRGKTNRKTSGETNGKTSGKTKEGRKSDGEL